MKPETLEKALLAADLALLRCPLTGQALVPEPRGAGVITNDGRIRYPVIDGIVSLTVASAQSSDGPAGQELGPVTAGLQRFYDEIGWRRSEDLFDDAKQFEDLRPVSAEYVHRCHLRVRDHLPSRGEILLDAGSGPVQFDEYLAYHEGFGRRLCIDISLNGLRQARSRVGDRGLYVQADVTRLPLADGSIDAAVSLHTIYHVDAGQQEQAFRELYRVLKPGGRAVVVYAWERTLLWRLVEAPRWIKLRLERLADRLRGGHDADGESLREEAGFYFRPHSARWFMSREWPTSPRLAVWRFLTVPTLRLYVHRWLGGRWLLRAVFAAETKWAERLARHAAYPLILIDRAPT